MTERGQEFKREDIREAKKQTNKQTKKCVCYPFWRKKNPVLDNLGKTFKVVLCDASFEIVLLF